MPRHLVEPPAFVALANWPLLCQTWSEFATALLSSECTQMESLRPPTDIMLKSRMLAHIIAVIALQQSTVVAGKASKWFIQVCVAREEQKYSLLHSQPEFSATLNDQSSAGRNGKMHVQGTCSRMKLLFVVL